MTVGIYSIKSCTETIKLLTKLHSIGTTVYFMLLWSQLSIVFNQTIKLF